MDIFKVLSRGASIKRSGKHENDLNLFRSKPANDNVDVQVSKSVDFFDKRPRQKPADKANKQTNGKGASNADDADIKDNGESTPLVISSEEEAEQHRRAHKIKVSGLDVPLPIGSFTDLTSRFDLHPHLLKNLANQKFDRPTPIQSEAVPIMLRDMDLIACAPTGSGKTLAFAIPLVQTLEKHSTGGIRCLILSPTKELATQIYDQVMRLSKGRDLNICILSKSAVGKLRNASESSSTQKFDILIATPRRLIDCLDIIDLSKVEHVVFDEADKLFEHGSKRNDADAMNSFAAQTDTILAACTNKKLRKAMFSATIPSGVEEMAHSIMTDPVRVIVGLKEGASDDVVQKLVFTGNEEGKLIAIRQLISEGKGDFVPPVIIFVQSIQRAKALFHELIYDRINVDVIHGERTQAQRDRVIARFKGGDIWVLICTDVLARGIDFQGVNLVINYDVPQSAQAYVHRIGRTGRAGRQGKAITFFTKDDSDAVKNVVNVMKQSTQADLSDWMLQMTKLGHNSKNKIKRKPVDRAEISTVPKVFKQKRKQRTEMIEASKRRKQEKQKAQD